MWQQIWADLVSGRMVTFTGGSSLLTFKLASPLQVVRELFDRKVVEHITKIICPLHTPPAFVGAVLFSLCSAIASALVVQ